MYIFIGLATPKNGDEKIFVKNHHVPKLADGQVSSSHA